ncbi:hypothetical protein ACOCJ4_16465 [Knoellia sp. CPCC 206435]|uniref:hypothetical protein n=1 Tax=Knoellia terrae TaxID=3404797 RepID=UPI003B43BD0B
MITVTGGGCSDAQTAGDAIALFRSSDNALVSARVQLGNDPANPRPWSTTLTVSQTLRTPADVEEPTTPGAYVIALYCNIGSSFRSPEHPDPATTPAEADLTKPFTVDGPITTPGGMTALAPSRLLDTRSGVGAPKAAVAAGGTVHLQVTGRGGVPASGVSAVVLNVTATAPTAGGYVTVFADGTTRPTASNLNFVAGQTVPNLVVAPVGANGKVALFNGSSGTVHLIGDSSGYFVAGNPTLPGTYGTLAPSRLLDTRSGVGAPKAAVAAGGTVHLQVTGRGGVPASGVSAVVLNVTATAPTAGGYVTVFADGTTRPTASNLNFVAGQTVPNLVVAPVGANGKVALFNGSSGTVHLIGDSSGYFRSP